MCLYLFVSNDADKLLGGSKMMKIHNKSDKPDNIIAKEHYIIDKCILIENSLPLFLRDYFIYLKNAVTVSTRLAYLEDIEYFFHYLKSNVAEFNGFINLSEITLQQFSMIKARDINYYIGEYCTRYVKTINENDYLFKNDNRSLARKKSSLSSMFKYLYRNEQLNNNITDGFNPIKLPKPQPDAIKKLDIDEVATMLDIVITGKGLTDKEKIYWEKTKLRDKAILLFFVTYGLRLSEIQQLNLSSFNYKRDEFKIYRKRSKEALMPFNSTIKEALGDYLTIERTSSERLDENHKDALFLSLQNKRLTMKAIRELVKKYTSLAMGTTRDKGYSPHKLRATAASSLIDYGFSIYDVKTLLDHENVTTTQLYSAQRKNLKRDIIKNFEWNEDKK